MPRCSCGREVAYLFSLPDRGPDWRGCAECVRRRRHPDGPSTAGLVTRQKRQPRKGKK